MPSRHHKKFEPLKPARKRLDNPYFRTRRSDRLKSSRVKGLLSGLPPRFWAYGFLVLIVMAGVIWLTAFSNILVIKNVSVSGVPEEDQLAYEGLAWEQSEQNRLWILPQSRLFVFNSQALIETINREYALNSVRVIKKLPDTLLIRITEKTPAATWFEADAYYVVDSEGWVVRQVTAPVAELPVLYNNGEARLQAKQVQGHAETIAAAKLLQQEFAGRFSQLQYRQLVVDNNRDTITVVLGGGQLIYVATNQPLADQLDRFDLLLRETLKDQVPKLRYVDLRYGDKIYYR